VAFSEIEKFPSAVLAHHYPGVPNWGDMTKFQEWPDADVDVLVGGTPCQSFSVAGLRKGLADPRGNLALTYLAIADKYRPEWLVWENVPGVLSADKGEAFGAFLGGLGELGYGWAYRVLDAQYFGLAQRRKRVFVVASLGGWQRAAAVLFDSASLRGDSAPRREAGQSPTASLRTRAPGSGGQGTDWEHTVAPALMARDGSSLTAPDFQAFLPVVTGTLGSRTTAGGGLGGDFECAGGVIPAPHMLSEVAPCLDASMDKKWGSNQWVDSGQFVMCASDGQPNAVVLDNQSPCLTSTNEQPYVAHTLRGNSGRNQIESDYIAHALRAEGFDASEDGTGRGTPLVPVGFYQNEGSHGSGDNTNIAPTLKGAKHSNFAAVAFDTTQITSAANYSNQKAGDPCHPLASGAHPPAIAASIGQRMRGQDDSCADNLQVAAGMQVRRLTPVECARLQGFPDTYLDITYRGKPAADGPKYKALGNSMAVPVMAWIGRRIQQVQDISKKELA
jgi:DNA (cytosine-5)-methyltransferase 1